LEFVDKILCNQINVYLLSFFWGEILLLGGPKKRKGNENPTKVFFGKIGQNSRILREKKG
jgi:hypothetical protein